MKQRITLEQIQELNKEQRKFLQERWKPSAGDIILFRPQGPTVGVVTYVDEENYLTLNGIGNKFYSAMTKKEDCFPFFTMGQLIEIAKELDADMTHALSPVLPRKLTHREIEKEVCDSLWKEILYTIEEFHTV